VSAQKPTIRKRMRRSDVTNVSASACFAAEPNAADTGLVGDDVDVVLGHPAIGAVGSLACACASKHRVNVAID
jgi:hypothetical protein